MKKLNVLAATLLAAPLLASAQSATYAIDPTHTFASYEIDHFGTSTNRGKFAKNSGTVQFDKAGKSGKVDLTLDMTAISTGVAALDKHLQSADFFDTANHPSARFVGERFTFAGDKVSEVAGQLTVRGKTLPVTLKAVRFNCYDNPMLKREVCGGDFETSLQRSQFGVSWGLNFGFPDVVKVLVQVEAVKQ
jgi:polyisoprenoid-binding protein YceI